MSDDQYREQGGQPGAASGSSSGRRPRRRVGAERGSAEWRKRVSHGTRTGMRRMRVTAGDVRALAEGRDVAPSVRKFVAAARDEYERIAEALGGEARLSPQRRAMLADAARLGALLGALVQQFIEAPDIEIPTKTSNLAAARRRLFETIGIDWHAEERGIEELARDHEAGPGAEEPDPEREERAQAIHEALREADWAPGEPPALDDADEDDPDRAADGDQGAE